MGEMALFKEVRQIVLSSYNKEATVIEGEDVLSLRPNEQGSQKLIRGIY